MQLVISWTYTANMFLLQKSDTWQDAAAEHKSIQAPWILFHRFGGEATFLLFSGNKLLIKMSDACDAILCLRAIYYNGSLPYPAGVQGALLYIQKHMLLG